MSEEATPNDVLGVRPGATRDEVKAAYRDLAKVWHPDRFGHDPRLQAKAQEKLKQINEAYEELISGRTRRKAAAHSSANSDFTSSRTTSPVEARRPISRTPLRWQLVVVSILVFAGGFFFTARSLFSRNQTQAQHTAAVEPQSSSDGPELSAREKGVDAPTAKRNTDKQADVPVSEPAAEPNQPRQAVETVTVLIDPSNGLLAKADCPVKSRMTFASGAQPAQYCNVAHVTPTPKDSKIKSVAKKLGFQ